MRSSWMSSDEMSMGRSVKNEERGEEASVVCGERYPVCVYLWDGWNAIYLL